MSIPGTNDYPNHLYFHAGGFLLVGRSVNRLKFHCHGAV